MNAAIPHKVLPLSSFIHSLCLSLSHELFFQVSVDCSNNLTLSYASVWETTALDTSSYHCFRSDKNFVVIKAVRGNNVKIDPCMVTLTDASRWATTLTFPMPNMSLWFNTTLTFNMTVIAEESQKDQLMVNGEKLNVTWKTVSFIIQRL